MVAAVSALLAVLATWGPGRARAAEGGSDAPSLIAGRLPVRSSGVHRPVRLTDGQVATRGDHWKTDRTSVFRSPSAFIEYDLGQDLPIHAAYLMGDNNDTYTLSISKDGVHFDKLWDAGPVGGRGLQPRLADNLDGTGRYLRVTAAGGDVSYAISEVAVYSERPAVFPPDLPAHAGIPPDEGLRNVILNFGLALIVFVCLAYRGGPVWWTGLLALLPLWSGWMLSNHIQDAWPVGQREISILRGTVGLVAAVTVLREGFSPRRYLSNVTAVVATLSVCASLALASFFNLGRAQYVDHKLGTPSFVHNFDMRVYYPVAKYFKELRFDGLYQASVAAYVDDDPSVTLDSLNHVQLRDLKNHHMTRVADVKFEIEHIKDRFSPERWEAFKTDMRYFRENMGVGDYLGSMSDHGGNATPVWITIAHFIFMNTHASNNTLFITAMLDPLLLLIAFVAIGRVFGVRTMLVCMVLFGANDFYMFGTNWAGATLRHDWMAYLGLGLCAMRRERWALAGALLALSAMIRAFPAVSLAILAVPVLWWGFEHYRREKKLPRFADFKRDQRAFLRVAVGATIAVAVLFVGSSLVLGFDAWPEWLHKVSLLNRDPHVNHVSLRGLIAGPDSVHNRILRGRTPLYIAAIAFYILLVALAARRRKMYQVSALGLLLIPVVFHPANYYIHFIFLMPLVATEVQSLKGAPRRPLSVGDAALWAAFLFVCAMQYWTVRESDLGLHFHFASAILFVGITAGLFALLADDALRLAAANGDLVEALGLQDVRRVAASGPALGSVAEAETRSETPPIIAAAAPEAPDQAEPEAPDQAEPEAPSETEPEAPSETEPEAPSETEPEAPSETEPADDAPAKDEDKPD
jgi:hypothetical protein